MGVPRPAVVSHLAVVSHPGVVSHLAASFAKRAFLSKATVVFVGDDCELLKRVFCRISELMPVEIPRI